LTPEQVASVRKNLAEAADLTERTLEGARVGGGAGAAEALTGALDVLLHEIRRALEVVGGMQAQDL
jgi:hypothetical protein